MSYLHAVVRLCVNTTVAESAAGFYRTLSLLVWWVFGLVLDFLLF